MNLPKVISWKVRMGTQATLMLKHSGGGGGRWAQASPSHYWGQVTPPQNAGVRICTRETTGPVEDVGGRDTQTDLYRLKALFWMLDIMWERVGRGGVGGRMAAAVTWASGAGGVDQGSGRTGKMFNRWPFSGLAARWMQGPGRREYVSGSGTRVPQVNGLLLLHRQPRISDDTT